jgi:hypothetical protein
MICKIVRHLLLLFLPTLLLLTASCGHLAAQAAGAATRPDDLETDPLEMNNLALSPQHKEALNAMREKLLAHLRSTQVNHAEGYKNKVQRMREAEAETKSKAAPGKAKP